GGQALRPPVRGAEARRQPRLLHPRRRQGEVEERPRLRQVESPEGGGPHLGCRDLQVLRLRPLLAVELPCSVGAGSRAAVRPPSLFGRILAKGPCGAIAANSAHEGWGCAAACMLQLLSFSCSHPPGRSSGLRGGTVLN